MVDDLWYMSCVKEREKVLSSRMGVRIRSYWWLKYPALDCNQLHLEGGCR